VEMHDEAARRGPHHSSFPMVIGPSRSSSPCGCSMLMSSSATSCDGDGGCSVARWQAGRE
jgi:hypothetical protein